MRYTRKRSFGQKLADYFSSFSSGRTISTLSLILILITLPVTAILTQRKDSTTQNASAATGVLPPIHVQGNKIVTDTGQQVILRGVNRGNGPEHACVNSSFAFGGPTDQASVQAMVNWKINIVRIPLNEDCWLGINGAVLGGAAYQQLIINYVNLLNQYGIYAIADLHINAPGTQPATRLQPMADADHALDFWRSVAYAFKGNNRVLFDLFNEPQKMSWSCWLNGGTARACNMPYVITGMQEMTNTIRATGASNILIAMDVFTSADQLGNWLPNKPKDPLNNIIAGFHAYGNYNGCTVSQTCWNTTIAPVMQQVPVFVGEIGESYDAGLCTTTFLSTFVPWLDNHQGNYTLWVWHPDTSSCGTNALISSWDGTPWSPHGTWYKNYLSTGVTPTPAPTNTPIPTPTPANTPTPTPTPTNTPTPTPSPTSTPKPSPTPPLNALRIDSGGTGGTGYYGVPWLADTGYLDGQTVNRGNIAIANTVNPWLYQTERYGMTGYSIPVQNGTYTVKLHFAETYSGITGAGQRVFSINAQGLQVISNLDVYAQAGGRNIALVKSFPVSITNGTLSLAFIKQVQEPMIDGIEILPQ